MAVVLKDAIKPNLVQTLEGQPAFVHCGPFANIAHGNNSLVADRVGLKLGEYVVTESGFASDMGMEKFFDITCRIGDLRPSAVVLVATVRALKHHGGDLDGGAAEIEAGAANLARHIGIVNGYGLQAVVGVNKFPTDTVEELELVRRLATEAGAYAAEINTAFEHGGDGATALAEAAIAAADEPNTFDFAYPLDAPIEEKIRLIATRVYGADGVELLPAAKKKAADWAELGARAAPDLHGEDAPLALARPGAQERADRLHRHRPRPAAVHGRRLDRRAVRRHDDDARPREDARGVRDRHRRVRRDRRPLLSASARADRADWRSRVRAIAREAALQGSRDRDSALADFDLR